jgi:RIP metalloprotease RseP
VFTATVTDGASVQTSSLTVDRLATKSSWLSAGVSESTSIIYVPTSQESTTGVVDAAANFITQDESLVITFGASGSEQTITVPVTTGMSMDDVVSAIGDSKGAPVVVRVLRNGRELSITAQPEFNRKLGRFTVGIVPEVKLVFVRYEGFDAVKRGAREFLLQSETFFSFLGKLLSGSASVRSLGGPIAIAEIAGKAGSAGLSNFVYFLGFISLQLGYFNLFPLPVLDGGLILMFLFELLKGGAVSPKLRERFQQVGFVLIALVMALVFYNDILRLLGLLGR